MIHSSSREQTSRSILSVIEILSGNVKEYLSSNFCAVLSSHGILHQSTCPHTPQHKWYFKEEKQTHVRTLLLIANIPVHHLGDIILTTCFLIKRKSSSIFNNKIPYSILFPNDSLFYISSCVFSCVYCL